MGRREPSADPCRHRGKGTRSITSESAQAVNAFPWGSFISSRPVVRLVWETGHRIVRLSGDAFQGIEIDGVDEHGHPATVILASDGSSGSAWR